MPPNRIPAWLVGVLVAAIVATGLAGPAQAGPAQAGPALAAPTVADEYDDQRSRNEGRQAEVAAAAERLAEELEDTDAALAQAYTELLVIDAQIPGAEQQLAQAEALVAQLQLEAQIIAERLAVAQAEEVTITGQIEADTVRADEIRVAIGQMARDAYKGDMASTSLSAVLDSTSTEEFVEQSSLASTALRTQTQALRDLEQINGVNRNRQARLAAVREQITGLKAEADQKVVEAEAARAEAEARRNELEALKAQQQDKAAQIEARKQVQLDKQAELDAQRASLEAELAEIVRLQAAERERQRQAAEAAAAAAEAQRQAAAAAVAAAAAAARAAAAAAGKPAPPPPPPLVAPPAPAGPGAGSTASRPFANPTSIRPMYVTSDYGMRLHPILGYWRLHAGTDLRTYCNTPIYAGASGTIQWAQPKAGFGNQVMLNSGYWQGSSLMSSYNHLTSFAVSTGDTVTQGQLIGYSGNTGLSGACHLHFEVYVDGATVDPRPLIG